MQTRVAGRVAVGRDHRANVGKWNRPGFWGLVLEEVEPVRLRINRGVKERSRPPELVGRDRAAGGEHVHAEGRVETQDLGLGGVGVDRAHDGTSEAAEGGDAVVGAGLGDVEETQRHRNAETTTDVGALRVQTVEVHINEWHERIEAELTSVEYISWDRRSSGCRGLSHLGLREASFVVVRERAEGILGSEAGNAATGADGIGIARGRGECFAERGPLGLVLLEALVHILAVRAIGRRGSTGCTGLERRAVRAHRQWQEHVTHTQRATAREQVAELGLVDRHLDVVLALVVADAGVDVGGDRSGEAD